MLKFVLRLFFLFLFVIHNQLTMAKEKDNQFDFPYVIANYTLTEDFLLKMEQIGNECENSSPESKVSNTEKAFNTETKYDDNVEGLVASISNKSKLMSILKKNNITPIDFVIGSLALQTTLTMLSGNVSFEDLKREGVFFGEKNTVVLDNLEFGKKHMYRMLVILKRRCE